MVHVRYSKADVRMPLTAPPISRVALLAMNFEFFLLCQRGNQQSRFLGPRSFPRPLSFKFTDVVSPPKPTLLRSSFLKEISFKKSALKQKEWTSVDRRGTRRDGPYVARVSRRECANRGYVLLDLFSNLENKLVHSFGSRKPLPASEKESM